MGIAIPTVNRSTLTLCSNAVSLTALFSLKAPVSIRGFRGFLLPLDPCLKQLPTWRQLSTLYVPLRGYTGPMGRVEIGGKRIRRTVNQDTAPYGGKKNLSYGLIHREDGITF